jgi:hypothetical protein
LNVLLVFSPTSRKFTKKQVEELEQKLDLTSLLNLDGSVGLVSFLPPF